MLSKESVVSNEVARVNKPWGYELHWAKTDRYVGKLIHVNAGHALSLQYHNQKDETIYLASGRMLFEIKEGEALVAREMSPGEAVHITPKTVHRMTAISDSITSASPPINQSRRSTRWMPWFISAPPPSSAQVPRQPPWS